MRIQSTTILAMLLSCLVSADEARLRKRGGDGIIRELKAKSQKISDTVFEEPQEMGAKSIKEPTVSGKSGKSGDSKSGKSDGRCLVAVMEPSNPDDVTGAYIYPDVEGTVTVCFDSSTNTWGTLVIDVMNLRPRITGVTTGGGVHVHNGTSCTSSTTQGPHYWKPSQYGIKKDGDPWYPESTEIAPTGTWYNTGTEGNAGRKFRFDQGYGYKLTVGKVIVIHDANTTDGGYKRVACGKLKPSLF